MSAQEVSGEGKASAPLLREGDLLGGRYKIDRCLGGGGMASVYRATHVGLDQPVAVKIVSPVIRELPGIVSRFMREARAATRLKGEHVVRVFDVGTTDDGAPFMVMELLEGRDLGELLDEGFRPSVEQAVDYVLQACEALAEVHGIGIVHRDLKPANLFVTRGADGLTFIKLIDFGISRVDTPLSPKDAVGLTSPEVVMGSPRYMPPEQMESAASADSRSDIWGLGAILYELLVGDPPYDGESLFDIYAAAVRSPPPAPSSVRKELPEDLDEVLFKCLRVDPAERYADVAELAVALAPFGDENAASRAEAIARVLDASRARGQGVDDVLTPAGTANKSSSTSRIRRRLSSQSRAARRRWRVTGLAAAALFLVGIGFAARPITRRLHPAPAPVTTSEATPPEAPRAEPPSTPAPPPAATEATEAVPAQTPTPAEEAAADERKAPETASEPAKTPKTTTSSKSKASKGTPRWHAAPRWTAPAQTTTTAPVATTTPTTPTATSSPSAPATSDLAPEPAPPPRAPAPRGEDRTLFEERK